MSVITTREYAAKFLYRATYGPKGSDIDDLLAMGEEAWFEQQFAQPIGTHLDKMLEFSQASGDKYVEADRYAAWFYRSITSSDQLRQRMAYALSQIFVVGKGGSETRAHYYDILLKHSFGNFRELLEAVTLDEAMGRYLSLAWSSKYNESKNSYPDENYAREVMQLFTIGLVELDSRGEPVLDEQGKTIATYTQNDIEEMARVLTGWRVANWPEPMAGNDNQHDFGEKVVMGEVFPAGQTIEQDLSQALDMLFNHPNTPVFIANLLIKRFSVSNPTNPYIRRVADAFKDNGQGVRGDMKAVLKAILLDKTLITEVAHAGNTIGRENKKRHFGKAKEPLLVMTNLCRALNVDSKDPTRWWDMGYLSSGYFGQAPLSAPSVFNFYSPDYSPQGEFSEKGITAPEFELFTMENIMGMSNQLYNKIIEYSWRYPERGWQWDDSDYLQALTNNADYIALLNERFYGGLMPSELEQYFDTTLTDMSSRGLTEAKKIEETLFIVQCSPEFRCQE